MRTITTTTELYKFEELTQEVQEKVVENTREILLQGRIDCGYIFEEDCEYYLADMYPQSELKVEFSLSSCQGDGLNIYGTLSLKDCIERNRNVLTEKEIEFLERYVNEIAEEFTLKENGHYGYCVVDKQDYFTEHDYDFQNWCEIEKIEDEQQEKYENTINKLEELIIRDLEHQAYALERNGYNYFYEMEDQEVIEHIEDMDYEFTEDGEYFF